MVGELCAEFLEGAGGAGGANAAHGGDDLVVSLQGIYRLAPASATELRQLVPDAEGSAMTRGIG